ncbi:hypothetical protein BS78_09G037300 [Paspalum vaginatum]|nr:hypothetical protein BS78_09G037300 [Paspalum vaginatum]
MPRLARDPPSDATACARRGRPAPAFCAHSTATARHGRPAHRPLADGAARRGRLRRTSSAAARLCCTPRPPRRTLAQPPCPRPPVRSAPRPRAHPGAATPDLHAARPTRPPRCGRHPLRERSDHVRSIP